jgi:hypothetical protein
MGVPAIFVENTAIAPDDKVTQFSDLLRHIRTGVETMSSQEMALALEQLRSISNSPRTQIVGSEVWGEPGVFVATHLKSSFEAAVNAVTKATGGALSSEDEQYLRFILTHWCGWSATYPEHINDPWVKYVTTNHTVGRALVPILDSMTYVEELPFFPQGLVFTEPSLFLFFGEGSFYVLWCWDEGPALFNAGKSLKEVYVGLRNLWFAESCDDGEWKYERNSYEMDEDECFPRYYLKSNGRFGIKGRYYGGPAQEVP